MDYVDIARLPTATVILTGRECTITKLPLLEWFELSSCMRRLLNAVLAFQVEATGSALDRFLEQATGLDTSDIDAEEGLVAVPLLWDLNQVQYIDPDFFDPTGDDNDELENAVRDRLGDDLDNRFLLDLEVTLAERFRLAEIREFTIDQAMLYYQKVLEDRALDRNVIYYSTKLGYKIKQQKSGKQFRELYKPRPSPYDPPWIRRRIERYRRIKSELLIELEPPPSRFIKYPDKVIDVRHGRVKESLERRKELGGKFKESERSVTS